MSTVQMMYQGKEVQVESFGQSLSTFIDEDGCRLTVSSKALKPIKRVKRVEELTEKHRMFMRLLDYHRVYLHCTMSENQSTEFEREYKAMTGEEITVGDTCGIFPSGGSNDKRTSYTIMIHDASALLQAWWPEGHEMMDVQHNTYKTGLSSKTVFFALLERGYRLGVNKPKLREEDNAS